MHTQRAVILLLLLLVACLPCTVHSRSGAPDLAWHLHRGRTPLFLPTPNQPPSSSSSSHSSSSSSFPRELAAVLVALSMASRDARAVLPASESLSSSPSAVEEVDEAAEREDGEMTRRREMRAEEPPLSLDLTFHILREMLQMARVEKLSNQADFNRKMMENVGK
ncbi:uncharacterized protein LOC116941573 [Petromyzon marinus]|uniref:uncharacterized protein LOC116941573 n=1 Tax=Petromyzon marinus TaxID=7757 RepID=UPI003F71970E